MDSFSNHQNLVQSQPQKITIPLICNSSRNLVRQKVKVLRTRNDRVSPNTQISSSFKNKHQRNTQQNKFHPSPFHSPKFQKIIKNKQTQKGLAKLPSQMTMHQTPNEVYTKKQLNGHQVKKILDQNLKNIYKIIKENIETCKLNKNKYHKKSYSKVPKLEKKIVQQYIKLIYNDYQIPNPLPELEQFNNLQAGQTVMMNHSDSNNQSGQFTNIQEYQKNNQRIRKSGTRMMNKKAIQLKQLFVQQLIVPTNIKKYQRNSLFLPIYQQKSNSLMSLSRNKYGHLDYQQQIREVFRYCFICQQPVLESNIQVHQRLKCPQFSELYEMNFQDLKSCIIKKIIRIKRQAEESYSLIFSKQKQEQNKQTLEILKDETKKYLYSVNSQIIQKRKLKNQKQALNKNFRTAYSKMITNYNNNYFPIYSHLQKLQWFMTMLKNLQQKQQRLQESQNYKIHQRRYPVSYSVGI